MVEDKIDMEVKAFWETTEMLKKYQCHKQRRPTLHLKGHIWSESLGKKLQLCRLYDLKLREAWSKATWEEIIVWGRIADWMQGKQSKFECLFPSIYFFHLVEGMG